MIGYPLDSRVTYDKDGIPVYDRAVTSAPLRKLTKSLFSDGILPNPSTNLQVVAAGDKVTIKAGFALCDGCQKLQEEDKTLTLPASDHTNNRIDTVVLRLNNNEDVRDCEFHLISGVAAPSPVRPALTRTESIWEIGLADIMRRSNSTEVTNANIADTRYETERCGIISSISRFDTTTLYQQVQDDLYRFQNVSQAEFNQWFENIRNVLSGDISGNLLNLINAVEDKLGELSDLKTAQKANLVAAVNELSTMISAASVSENNLALTNTKTDLLDVDLIHPASAKNKVHKIGTGNASALSNSPVKTGHFYGKWECIFHTVSGSNSRVMVKITEFYPVQGRVWFNHYNWTSWSGWFSEEEARNRLSRDIGALSSLNTGNKENVVHAINWLKSHIDAYNTANLTSSTFATLKEFVAATSKVNMVPKLLRFRDSGGWGPLGGSGNWYRAIAFYQNPYVAGGQYTVGGDVLFYCGGGTSIYYGHIEGTYDADNLTITYFRVFTADSGCFVNSAQAIKANTGRHVAAGALGVKEIYNEVKNELTANNKQFYFDYKNGKYGFNTDPNRGADTFSPFSNGGSVLLVSLHNSTGSLSGFVPTAAPPYPETLINGDGMQTLIEADSFKVASATELVCNKSGTLHLLGQTYVSGGAHHYYLTKNGADNLVPNSYNHLKYSIHVQKGDKIKIKWTRTAAYAIVATFVLAL